MRRAWWSPRCGNSSTRTWSTSASRSARARPTRTSSRRAADQARLLPRRHHRHRLVPGQRRQRLHDRPDDPHRRRLGHESKPRRTTPDFPNTTGATPHPKGVSNVTRPDAQPAHPAGPRTQLAMGAKLPAWGHTSVDFERRIDHDRLRRYRLARTRQSLAELAGRLAAAVRREQHPLRQRHQDRRMGAGQDVPLLPADRRRQPLCLGFRLGRGAPPALFRLAGARSLPRRRRRHARHDPARIRPDAQIRQDDRRADQGCRHGRHAGGRGLCRNRDVPRAAGRGHQGRRRPADHAGGARDQELGRDPAC